MICKYCGDNKKLIKAHTIPAAFFRRLRHGRYPPIVLVNKKGEYPKRAPVGVYDNRILCESCESQFGDWDNYAQQLLQDPPKDATPIVYGGQTMGYEIKDYKYDVLKLFFVSVLWRASMSEVTFYQRINLGPYESYAKKLIANR